MDIPAQTKEGFPLTADRYRAYSTELERLKKSIADGTAKPCLGADLLQTVEKSNLTEKHRLYTLGALLEAGSDTSRIAINQILGAAAVYPDWAQRVQAQLDSVCGANAERLPSFNDRKQLPLVTATVKEGLRWRPMAELGIPHLCTQDDEFEGYSWPAGTVFVINAYGIALDPKEYAEPERFWPERFLNEHLDNALQGHWGFGAGKTSTRAVFHDLQLILLNQEDEPVWVTKWVIITYGSLLHRCYTALILPRIR